MNKADRAKMENKIMSMIKTALRMAKLDSVSCPMPTWTMLSRWVSQQNFSIESVHVSDLNSLSLQSDCLVAWQLKDRGMIVICNPSLGFNPKAKYNAWGEFVKLADCDLSNQTIIILDDDKMYLYNP